MTAAKLLSVAPPDLQAQHLQTQPLRFLNAYWNVWQHLAGRLDFALARAHDLDLRAFIALSYVQGGVTSPGELARAMGVPKYEVTRTLDRLSRLRAVARESDPLSARRQRLSATPEGRALWQAALSTVQAVAAPPLRALGSRLADLTSGLEQLAAQAHLSQETA